MSIPTPQTRTTPQFYLQSIIAFAVSTIGVSVGIAYLPVDLWMRAFLGMSVLFVITATFTLAKCVRDRQEDVLAAEQAQYYQQMPIWNGTEQQPAQRS
ncbi:YiaA/B family two helix domain-containing protein [Nocardiopsis sp. Huas11]|uniref:YiaA/YiaB family inner membrane protein n=1 Tax=Nocardiopsis sp. Huas11 TaxID=2183912 RepID=UPI000EB3232E|nr:YiaA/YiaB family inner membrane protein [Nocardiopsis sp. Huas11]RKS08786.1 YiaA/B family two helix domain-containing protein [Nocardiopsis sp. Huas11]